MMRGSLRKGKPMSEELTIAAKTDNLDEVLEFVGKLLEGAECPMKAKLQIDVAVEEIFVNIAHYAYGKDGGMAKITVSTEDSPRAAVIEFCDSGMPFDPLAKPDPDTTLSAADREIGGLGIFMVKKSMDEVAYRYEDGQNIFTMKKLM